MTIYSVSDFNEIIREQSKKFGFEVAPCTHLRYYQILSDEVNFTFSMEDGGSDWKNGIERDAMKVNASVRKMGGQPTVDQLLKTADEINRAAQLMEAINSMNIVIETHFGEE